MNTRSTINVPAAMKLLTPHLDALYMSDGDTPTRPISPMPRIGDTTAIPMERSNATMFSIADQQRFHRLALKWAKPAKPRTARRAKSWPARKAKPRKRYNSHKGKKKKWVPRKKYLAQLKRKRGRR